jgi:sugar (pentulose or hexulose) kinase
MTAPRYVAVIDIGKTNAKLALVDLESLTERDVRKVPNRVLADGPYPHFDTEALWAFILDGLAALAAESRIDAISITTHGVAAALLDQAGELVLPVLDYEHDGPQSMAASYDELRPPFAESGTPRLPVGLNLGAQFWWQSQAFPDAFVQVRTILTYPQYWAWRLTGIAAAEVTSLGCHTDLWSPAARDYSSMVDALGWRKLFPDIRPAAERLGTILPAIAARTDLPADTPVHCGIHDSNASLLPHLMAREAPFAVVSTGTWVIAMAVGAAPRALDPARDTLVNVDAFGDPVPSARFMGGREFSTLLGSEPQPASDDEIARVLACETMLLPSLERGSGPFPRRKGGWTSPEPTAPGERMAAVSFYLAMMTSVSLGLIGAAGDIVVEGPFAANDAFTRMLATATGRRVLTSSSGVTGTSIGAALLARSSKSFALPGNSERVATLNPEWRSYAQAWMQAAEQP